MAVSTVGAGRDYSTLSAWESAAQGDLTGNGPEEAECYGAITDNLSMIGWTTTASDYIRIYAASGEEHLGIPGDGVVITTNTSSPTIRWTDPDHVRIEGIEIDAAGSSTSTSCISDSGNAGSDIRIESCILHDSSSYGLDFTTGLNYVRNTIIYDCVRSADIRGAGASIQNCTLYSNGDLGIVADAGNTIENTYSGGHSSEDFWTGGTAPSGNNNASSDTTATTDFSSSLVSLAATDQFTNVVTFDFHLKAGNDLDGAGAVISGLTTDIDGDTRSGTAPSIGADETVGGGGGVTVGGGLLTGLKLNRVRLVA